jgi:hypothetical protein
MSDAYNNEFAEFMNLIQDNTCERIEVCIKDLLPGDYDIVVNKLIVAVQNDASYTRVTVMDHNCSIKELAWMSLSVTTVLRMM